MEACSSPRRPFPSPVPFWAFFLVFSTDAMAAAAAAAAAFKTLFSEAFPALFREKRVFVRVFEELNFLGFSLLLVIFQAQC